jgi:hypothetical protein
MIGDGLISLSIDQGRVQRLVVNTGSIDRRRRHGLLAARSANALLDTVINNSGVIGPTRSSSATEKSFSMAATAGS